MNTFLLRMLCESKRLSQSDLARLAGTSRQAVSLWFSKPPKSKQIPYINVRSENISKLSQALKISADALVEKYPEQKTTHIHSLESQLLWDRCYQDLPAFVVALARREWKAMGRLVQIKGFYFSAQVLGKDVWKDFPKYKKYISPQRRNELEKLWQHISK